MKKFFLSMCLMALCLVSFAGNIKVTSGDKKVFKNFSGNVLLEFVWDGATFDNSQPLESKFENLEDLKGVAWNGFVENFNDNCKNCQIVKEASDAVLKITMKVTNMDQYVKIMGFVPAPATKVWGTMTITNIATGEVVTTVEVNAVDGGANPSPDGTFSDCFEDLGDRVSDLR